MNIYDKYDCVIESCVHPELRYHARKELKELNTYNIPRDKGMMLLELVDNRLNIKSEDDYADIFLHTYDTLTLALSSDTGSVWDPIRIRLTNTESKSIHDALSWLLRSACACGCTKNLKAIESNYSEDDVLSLMKIFVHDTSKSLFKYI